MAPFWWRTKGCPWAFSVMMRASDSKSMIQELTTGWRVLLAAFLGISMATTAIPFYSMGVFITPLEAAKGWSRSDITTAAMLFSFCLPASILTLGYAIDRFGVRRVVVVGHVMLGLSFLSLSFVGDSLHVFWGLYALAALTAAGASPIGYTRAVIQYFGQNRGLAIGICMSSTGLGAALAPPLLEKIIRLHGWQAGYQALAGTLFFVSIVVFFLLPKITGPAKDKTAPTNADVLLPLNARQSTMMLMLICAAIFFVALAVNGYIVHFVPLLQGEGMTAGEAAMVASYIGISIILGRLMTGFLLDRVSTGIIGCTIFALAAGGILLLQQAGVNAAPIAAILIGFTVGAEVDIVAYLVSKTFRAQDFTRNFSWVYSLFMVGSGLSPLLAGYIFDQTGGYDLFFTLSSGLLIVISLAFMALHVVQRRPAQAEVAR